MSMIGDFRQHGIHFLLTGTAWDGELPLAFIARGGRELGDAGYGPARIFSSDEEQEEALIVYVS